MISAIAVLFAVFASVSAMADLDGLTVTWDVNPLNTWAFDTIAREAKNLGRKFTVRDDFCAQDGNFVGSRYWYDKDPAMTLLFDINGVIAGIQTSIPKDKFTPSEYMQNRNFVEDGDYWTLTAYFVHPSKVCSRGRNNNKLVTEGTAEGLWFQVGPNPMTDLVSIPMIEDGAKSSAWKYGKCFYTMGEHYWYNVSKDMSCDQFFPNCILYNKGKLTGFCFSIPANLESKRYEHPMAKDAKMFISPVPDCFYGNPGYNPSSTLHVYFIRNPRLEAYC